MLRYRCFAGTSVAMAAALSLLIGCPPAPVIKDDPSPVDPPPVPNDGDANSGGTSEGQDPANAEPPVSGASRILFVDDDATLGGDGISWATAFTELQDALAVATAGDEIRVAEGTYTPDQDEAGNVTPGDRHATFQPISGVALYGGYAGGGGPDPDQRDIVLHETILSGDLLGDDAPVACEVDYPDCAFSYCISGFCAMDAGKGENSYHVVTVGPFATVILDGLTIASGNGVGGIPLNRGSGMFNDFSSSPTVTNCTFSRNSATGVGGGMYNSPGSSPTVTNCTFRRNLAGLGGGMYNNRANPTVTNCTFIENSATGDGGGMNNQNDSSVTVTNSAFIENTAVSGGGMVNFLANSTVTNCTFSGNSAVHGPGGGMSNYRSSPTVVNCTFSGNSAAASFPLAAPGAPSGAGGGMANDDSSPNVMNCTFSANTAENNGGGMYNQFGSPMLTNCIFWGNYSSQIFDMSGTQVVTYSIVQGGWTGAGGVGNLNSDPLFVDADGPDGTPGTDDDDLRLRSGSPCIDAGDNTAFPPGVTSDLLGNLRFFDDPRIPDAGIGPPPIVDIGAYEFGSVKPSSR